MVVISTNYDLLEGKTTERPVCFQDLLLKTEEEDEPEAHKLVIGSGSHLVSSRVNTEDEPSWKETAL